MNYEKLVRKLRSHPLLWDDGPKGEQVGRLIDEAKKRQGIVAFSDAEVEAMQYGMPAICPNVGTD